MESLYFKLVCVDETDPIEYRVLEDVNKGSLDEVHEFIKERFEKHKGAKWMMFPCICKIK